MEKTAIKYIKREEADKVVAEMNAQFNAACSCPEKKLQPYILLDLNAFGGAAKQPLIT